MERVTPGVWSVPVPIPDNPLRYVLSYLIEHAAGFVLVDPGWDAPGELAGADRRAGRVRGAAGRGHRRAHHARAPGPPRPVRRGAGGVRRVDRHARSARTRCSPRFARPHAPARWPAYLRWCGAPDEHIGQLTDGGRRNAPARPGAAMVRADRLIGARRSDRRARAAAARGLDARPLARPPVLPRRDPRAAAHRRPRAAAHHAQHLRLRPWNPSRSPSTWTPWTRLRGDAAERGAAGARVPVRRPGCAA